jgi:uncharacterized phage protein (TIGR02218 family)
MTSAALFSHLATGTTTVCRAWTLTRKDGVVLGFTDHDRDLMIEGVMHRADSGLTASTLQKGAGLAVDNSEVLGALSAAAISDVDVSAGRYDGAEIRMRLVNWKDLSASVDTFRGTLGEVNRLGTEFRAELRGLTEPLNQPVGLAYTRDCSAVLGDSRCRFDLTAPGYFAERAVEELDQERRTFRFVTFAGFDDRWFEGGRLEVLSGAAAGLAGLVKSDRSVGSGRVIELWQGVRADLAAGDQIRILAGCDKRAETCRVKFANLLNFRGFPFIPGEDWLSAYPVSGQDNTGASRYNR